MRCWGRGPSDSEVAMMRLVINSISASTSESWTSTSKLSFTYVLPDGQCSIFVCHLATELEDATMQTG